MRILEIIGGFTVLLVVLYIVLLFIHAAVGAPLPPCGNQWCRWCHPFGDHD